MTYRPPHEVTDTAKVKAMVAALERGETLPPVIVCGEIAFSGSHRLAAWKHLGLAPEAVEIEDAEYCAAMEALDLDPLYDECHDLDDLVTALRSNGVALGTAE